MITWAVYSISKLSLIDPNMWCYEGKFKSYEKALSYACDRRRKRYGRVYHVVQHDYDGHAITHFEMWPPPIRTYNSLP